MENAKVKTVAEITKTMTFDEQSLEVTVETTDGKISDDITLRWKASPEAQRAAPFYIPREFVPFLRSMLT